MFPNGFLDQNGIYYVNSYDPYSLMVYNAPTYYDTCTRPKKYNSESLVETASTTNEETPQDGVNHNSEAQGDEVQNTALPPANGHPHHPPHMPLPTEYGQVYNVVYPGFFYNGLCPQQDLVNGQNHHSEPKRIKRRRRRKLSSSKPDGLQQNGTTSEYTEDDDTSTDEDDEATQNTPPIEDNAPAVSTLPNNQTNETSEAQTNPENGACDEPTASDRANASCDTENLQNGTSERHSDCNEPDETETAVNSLNLSDTNTSEKKYDLKPDAQEFVPRALRPENLQYIKIPPSFVPVLSPLSAQNYAHGYLPPGIPVNFIPPSHPVYPGYLPGYPNFNPEQIQSPLNVIPQEEEPHPNQPAELAPPAHEIKNKSDIDIRTVVSKLEEVANEPPKAEGSFERRNKYPQHVSPSKKPIRNRNYEERPKFFPKNNRQNGYYQKRPYNKYQNNVHNETQQNHKEIVNEIQNYQKIDEIVPNGVQIHVREIGETQLEASGEKVPEVNTNSQMVQQNQISNGENQVLDDKEVLPNVPNPKAQNEGVKERPHPSPKFNRFRENNEDRNGTGEFRKRWPRKDDRNVQRVDQSVQHPEERANHAYKTNDSPNHKTPRRFGPTSPTKRQINNNYPQENVKKYSETVKRSPQTIKQPISNVAKVVQEIKPVIPEVSNTLTNTQWISVSSKKKRRNKNVEEFEDNAEVIEESPAIKVEEFEQNAYLQNIVDSCPPDVQERQPVLEEPQVEVKVEEVIEIPEKVQSPKKILEVRDLEKELLNSVGIEVKEETPVSPIEESVGQVKSKSKKKSKKTNQKTSVKRVIITDIDLSESIPEDKMEEIIEETQPTPAPIEVETVIEDVIEEQVELVEETPVRDHTENPEKKSKKKKKKQSKGIETTPNSTLSEDTYDLLLENTFSNNSEDKTNMEISQELDLIIQRGMYSSLEEKIKSLNIIPIKQEFFRSMVRSRESSMEKSPEFTKLLANSMPKFKYCMASVEDEAVKYPINNLDQPSTSKNGLFVENLEVNELLKDIYGENGTPEAEIVEILKKVSPPREIKLEINKNSEEIKLYKSRESSVTADETDKEKLYPITQAVKNWMSKTRENTPEVEILKSPSVIFREFREKSSEAENGKRNSVISESDEEITVYSASRNDSDSVDLLDCWENDISIHSGRKSSTEEGCDKESKMNGDNKDGDVIEVYESKYGRNEDFLELQKEIEEKKRLENDARSRNFPKHGALPYRAICCNVM
ncbi:hypothetical protein HHI36_021149 [Cryptolaemus montrouzieri]|uniref:Titin-like n=1 Tax=Cryptolaemus montrouzieri TaxID=559131 RepID=A0ABD2MVV6_9CUCU